MRALRKFVPFASLVLVGCLGFFSTALAQSGAATIQRVDVLDHSDNFELEIRTSQPITPRTQVVTGPDRLVIDFPNAVPGPQLHAIAVKALHVKSVRMGLFESNPPVARVVVDLNSPQPYQIFPSGKSVIVKITGGTAMATMPAPATSSTAPAVIASNPAVPTPAPPKPAPTFQVEFIDGKLRVQAEHATLGEVLRAIAQKTGAKVSLPPAAEQEPVIASVGPGPARDVVSALLNGVPFNVVLMGSGRDLSQVTSIQLTARSATASGGATLPANYAPAPVQAVPDEPEPEPAPPPPPPIGQDNPPPQDAPPPQ